MYTQGSHSVQIWWKGDPGVENFTIKFLTEEMMKKWATGLETQRKENAPRQATSPDDNATDFAWTRDQAGELENPYLQQQDDDDDDDYGPATAPAQFPMPTPTFGGGAIPRTSSSSNLRDMRQRSVTAETSQSLASIARAPPPRFPLPMPPPAPLSLQTQSSMTIPSPGVRGGDSYFSPIGDSPASSRTSTTSGVFPPNGYPFPKTVTPQPGWDENNRYTAPAMPRAPSRDGTPPSGRNPRGPSLPPMSTQSVSSGANHQQQRSRSYSTPDVNAQGQRRQPSQGNIPAVPGIPMHLHHPAHDSSIPRSQTGSPRNEAPAPTRTSTQSPGTQGQRMHKHSGSVGGTMAQFPTQPIYPRQTTPGPPTSSNGLRVDPAVANSRTVSPSLGTSTMSQGMLAHHGMIPQGMMPQSSHGSIPQHGPAAGNPLASPDLAMPTQLKVRVSLDSGNYVTLVVAFNITYQSLVDRIDAKLARFTSSSIAQGMLKLRYQDEDEDFVTIESDDDIQIAFMEFRDGMKSAYNTGVGEIELFCVGDMAA